MVADGRNDFCLSWLLFFFGQGTGSDWQAQRQSAISGSGGDPEFCMWNLGSFFCCGKRLMDSFGLRSDFCQVYWFFCANV